MLEQTDSEIACEEAARLTAELQDGGDSPDDDDEINYNELPPPPGKLLISMRFKFPRNLVESPFLHSKLTLKFYQKTQTEDMAG